MLETSTSLLDRLRSPSDAEAWNRLVELYTPVLRAWLRRYDVLSNADVQDPVMSDQQELRQRREAWPKP